MPQKRYIVRLTAQEREVCQQTVRKLNGSSERVRRAQILLQGRCGRAGVDRPADRRRRSVPHQDRREHSPTMRAGGVRAGAGTQTARVPAGPETAQRRAGGSHHRLASGAAPEGLCQLVVAAVGAQGRRVGDRRVGQPRNRPADAEKNWMTQRKIEYWVIPPQADAEFVANMEQVLDLYQKPYDPGLSRRVHGRAAGAVGQGSPPADGGHEEPSPACRLRVRTGWYGVGLPVQRTAGGLAAGDGPEPGVRRRTGRWKLPACWKDATPIARRSPW